MNPITAALAAIVGTAVILCGFYEFKRIPQATDVARSAVLLEVKDQQLRAQAKAEADRKAAQDKITRIEADYFNRRAADAVQIQTLNEAIDNVEKAPAGTCSPALPSQLRDILNGVGREAIPGDRATVPAPAVRPASRASKRSTVERRGGSAVGF